jgi:iron complex outermembrane recepter protein
MRKFIVLAQILLIFISTISFSFAQSIKGKILDATTSKGIEAASILVKGTKQGTSSNVGGDFSIKANVGNTLEVSATGYTAQEVKINSENITIMLQPSTTDLVDVVVVGTRGLPRAKTETAVPIDIIKINQIGAPTAKMDLTSVLNMAAPSFNYNKQSGSDGADHVDLGTLRGLGPDQTLVLINGKRRHSTAFVALFGTRGRGASGTDLNAFPQSGVDRIEILRDGASAQYGSDAMAGVMNIILKKDINHWTITTGVAGYYDTKFNARKFNAGNQYYSGNKIDGSTFSFSATNGFALGNNGGYVSFALDYLTQGKTFRQVDTTDWQNKKDNLQYINTGRRAFGDGSVTTFGSMYNMELPIKNTKTTFYSFATVNTKESDAFAYTRNLSARPDRFPVDAGGNPIFVNDIMRVTNDGEVYYNPHIGTNINDASIALGLKGKSVRDWNWDASLTTGKNDFQYYGDKTFNATLIGNTKKTFFDDGGFRFRQTTINLDFSKAFTKVASGLNVGYGFEVRNEKYKINKGEEASYASYDLTLGQAPGSQGFPGFSPADSITAKRSSVSAYVDGEINISKAWMIDAAVRAENYQDFGYIATYKLATRVKATDNFNIRGSVSTGYRAPSLQQINFSNTLTSFSGGILVQSRIARNGDAVTKAAGIPALKQETSINTSVGFAWKPVKGLTFTVDGYMVKIKDRVVLSGLFSESDATLPASFTSQLTSLGVATAQFFTNAVNTTNYGLDIVADYSKSWENKKLKVLLAGNLQKMLVNKINVPAALSGTVLNQKTFFSDREIAFLKASAPNAKINLSIDYSCNKLGFGTHITSFGTVKLTGFGAPTAENPNYGGINPEVPDDATGALVPEIFNYKTKIVADIYASYKISKKISFFAGIDNVFNIHPELGVNPLAKGYAQDNESGGAWDSVQMGFNGRKLFSRLVLNF